MRVHLFGLSLKVTKEEKNEGQRRRNQNSSAKMKKNRKCL
jgi:hypothetical protein